MHNSVNCDKDLCQGIHIFLHSLLLHLTNEGLGSSDLKLDSNISIFVCSWEPVHYG